MHPLGQYAIHRSHQARYEGDWAAAAQWRRLHQRSDATPLPPEPERVSLLERVAAALPHWRRPRLGGV
jgi:hypothetical protein